MVKTELVALNPERPKSFAKWWRSWSIGAVIFWGLIYLLIAKILSLTSARLIYGTAAIHITATVLIGPLVFKAVRRFRSSETRDFGLFFLAASLSLFSTLMCWIYSGLRAGLLPSTDARILYTIGVVGSFLSPLAAFYLRKMFRHRPIVPTERDLKM